jgi:Ca2+-binding RTX toxin-like protein
MVAIVNRTVLKGIVDYSDLSYGVDIDLSNYIDSSGWAVTVNKVIGTTSADVIIGNDTRNQQLIGNGGSDTFYGLGYGTSYIGSSGSDTVNFSLQQNSVYVDLSQNTSYRGEHFTSIENLVGGGGNDTLIGNDAVNVLTGGSGSDILDGRGGADIMVGGKGDDMYSVENSADQIIENSGEGTDMVSSKISYALGQNLENLELLGATAINGTGNGAGNLILGNNAANKLLGLDGNDILQGNGGNDILNGGNGDDKLYGGSGQDTLTGGSGKDTYYLSASGDSKVSARDHITDFTQGQDKIGLTAMDANTMKSGDQAFAFIGSTSFSNKAGELRLEKHDGYTVVQGDTNGDGVADFAIELDHFTYTMKASDFLL